MHRKFFEFFSHFFEAQPEALSEDNKGYSPQNRAWIPAVARTGAFRAD
jgi:hypothetical protein